VILKEDEILEEETKNIDRKKKKKKKEKDRAATDDSERQYNSRKAVELENNTSLLKEKSRKNSK